MKAHRLMGQGGVWQVEEVWRMAKSPKREESINLFRPAWRDGRLYNGGAILDVREGKWIAARRSPLNQGYCGQGSILIGPVVFSWNFYGESKGSDKTGTPLMAHFVWHDPGTGAKVGEGSLPINPADGHSPEFKREPACRDSWRWLGAATPFARKDRLYVRAYDFLWCIGAH